MENIFLTVLNLSISASWLIVIVILCRLIFKKAPKSMRYILWLLVGIRLICSISLESPWSMIPSAETVPVEIVDAKIPKIETGIDSVNQVVNPILAETMAPNPVESVNPMQVVISVASVIWIIGVTAMLAYIFVSYLRVKRKTRASIKLKDKIWVCDDITSPFILGFVRPRIFIPSNTNEEEIPYIVAHEEEHLRYRDNWWKPLGFLSLAVHWFNPLVWVSYVLMCRDMELACDERVIWRMNSDEKKKYSEILLSFGELKRVVTTCPVAFGEVGIKQRIKSIVNFKRPSGWIIAAALLVSVVVGVCFMTNPDGILTDNLAKTSSIISNNNSNSRTAEDEDFIYYFYMPTVKKMSKADNSVEDIYTFEDIYTIVNAFECFGDRLYFLTYKGELISMDKNGENLLKARFSLDDSEELLEYDSPTPTPYVFGDNLYFIPSDLSAAYRVDPDTLALELADPGIAYQHITSDKTIFIKKAEDEVGRLYVKPDNEDMTLFSAEDESVILNRVNFTDYYVFYMAFKSNDFSTLYLYRVDLDGENKVLIKEVGVANNTGNIKYDNEYIYLVASEDEYLKIHKETLEETNIASMVDDVNKVHNHEISNEKFFHAFFEYYIDGETGEKVEL